MSLPFLQIKKPLALEGAGGLFRGATLLDRSDNTGWPSLSGTVLALKDDTPGFVNASPASKPTHSSVRFSVCGSQVHSAPALASAHTLPDSLSPALELTNPVPSLYIIQLYLI